MRQIGKIRKMYPTFQWEIPDFSSLSTEVGELFYSPYFKFGSAFWCLEIYPNGISPEWCGNISLYLVRKKSKCSKHIVTCKTSLKDTGENEFIYRELVKREYADMEHGRGWPDYLTRSRILKELNNDGNGTLIILCTVSWDRVVEVPKIPVLDKDQILIRNIRSLLLSKEDDYVILKVEGQEFRAHKEILEAQSPVFTSMFQYDILERNIGTVDIPDCNSDIFLEFLVYLYSGRVEKMDTKRRDGLYKMADKFSIPDLKKQCTDQDLHNFRILLLSKEDDYMILKVEGQEFRVHKTIIEAQCPAFTSMFRTGFVDIPNCDSDLFQDFLVYLYSGRVVTTDAKRIVVLHKMAIMFCMGELKEKCEEFIRKPMMKKRPVTFCDTIVGSLTAPFQ